MDQIKKYWPVLLISLGAVIVTGLVLYTQGPESARFTEKDTWGFPLWLTPLGYLLLALIFKGGVKNANQPVYAVVALFVYALAGVALFLPLPSQVEWHYIIGTMTIIYIFAG